MKAPHAQRRDRLGRWLSRPEVACPAAALAAASMSSLLVTNVPITLLCGGALLLLLPLPR